jgi:hypothetical protein
MSVHSSENFLSYCDTILNFTENSVKMTKTDYDPNRSLVLIEGLSHFVSNFNKI